jgi:hypothetical protein
MDWDVGIVGLGAEVGRDGDSRWVGRGDLGWVGMGLEGLVHKQGGRL